MFDAGEEVGSAAADFLLVDQSFVAEEFLDFYLIGRLNDDERLLGF